jgi:hypothetical protein
VGKSLSRDGSDLYFPSAFRGTNLYCAFSTLQLLCEKSKDSLLSQIVLLNPFMFGNSNFLQLDKLYTTKMARNICIKIMSSTSNWKMEKKVHSVPSDKLRN